MEECYCTVGHVELSDSGDMSTFHLPLMEANVHTYLISSIGSAISHGNANVYLHYNFPLKVPTGSSV